MTRRMDVRPIAVGWMAAGAAGLALAFTLIARAAPPAAKGPAPIAAATRDAGSVVPAVAGLPPMQATVKITIITVPSARKTFVSWGKRKLGVIEPRKPLIIERPRDSGPLDLIVTSDGYVTVQTRAFTFADTKLAVKLTPIDQKNTLLGYREELPPAAPDAGAPVSSGAPGVSGGLPPTIAAPPVAQPMAPVPGRDAGAR